MIPKTPGMDRNKEAPILHRKSHRQRKKTQIAHILGHREPFPETSHKTTQITQNEKTQMTKKNHTFSITGSSALDLGFGLSVQGRGEFGN